MLVHAKPAEGHERLDVRDEPARITLRTNPGEAVIFTFNEQDQLATVRTERVTEDGAQEER